MAGLLKEKVAIVTGAGRGIGAAVAKKLASEGAKVVVNFVSNQSEADKVVSSLVAAGGAAVAVKADVSTATGAEALFAAAEQTFGGVDVLVNNAGLPLYKKVESVSEDEFDKIFGVNVKGVFLTCKLAATRLREHGAIVNFSSSTTALMLPTYAIYVATKGAVEQFSHVFAKEMGPRNIRVNVISPGPTDTELFTQGKSDEDIKRLAGLAAFNRIGKPEEIANVVAWLVSDEAAWVTGQNVRANGGMI